MRRLTKQNLQEFLDKEREKVIGSRKWSKSYQFRQASELVAGTEKAKNDYLKTAEVLRLIETLEEEFVY